MSTSTVDLSTREVQRLLRVIGWPIGVDGSMGDRTHQAISEFQRGFAFWSLLVDGHAGPKTERALRFCANHEGRCSPNFRFVEFRSKGNGWIRLRRELVLGLEEVRVAIRRGIAIQSGYRDPAHNKANGGASNSQHLYGNAADVEPNLPLQVVRAARRFSGIGIRESDGTVAHVDVRHLGPNTTHATITDPTIWYYA